MNPNQVSAELRRIASAINNSKNPSRELVLQDIRRVLASMDETAGMEHEAGMGSMGTAFRGICTALGLSAAACMPSTASLMASSDAMMECMRNTQKDEKSCSAALGQASEKAMMKAGLPKKAFMGCEMEYHEGELIMHCDVDGKKKDVVVDLNTVR